MVFVNGFYAPDLSALLPMPKSVEAHNLEKVLASAPEAIEHYLARYARHDNHPFAALNTALLRDGACIYVPRNIVLETPLHLIFVSTGAAEPTVSHPRNLIVAGENSQFTLIESYVGLEEGTCLTNAVTEIVVGENAFVDHYRVQQESLTAYHMSTLHVHIERNANFSSHAFALGGGIARSDITAVMNDEGIECTLNGLYLVDGQRLIDSHTALDHAKPHCSSHQLYKGILSERGRGVFNGKIYVRPDAQKTDAKQTNQALLLSDDAQINTKPQLEIFADDVKCTHGATVGQLDADALFYLRARGIGREDARNLLIHAFAGDIINRVKVEPLRGYLDKTLYERLPG
jgi:Fe-S cluster assembly protein SufD